MSRGKKLNKAQHFFSTQINNNYNNISNNKNNNANNNA